MTDLIHDDFLLKTATARRLYHEFAAGLPIIDYHNHLGARDLAEDRVFENISQLWVVGDPYKHRAMRIAGVPERFITGDATDREKFDAWAASCTTGWATRYKPACCPTRTNSSARSCAASAMITLTVGCFPKEPRPTNRLDF